MTVHIRTETSDVTTQEYGGDFRRLYPWSGVAQTPWGSAFMSVAPGQTSQAHSHDEEETFIFLGGSGVIHVDDANSPVTGGDVVYLPRFSTHCVENTGAEALSFLTIWWGAPEDDAPDTSGTTPETSKTGEPK